MFAATRCGVMTSKGEKDPYWSNVVLLLSMDGTEGGTTFTDLSSFAHTVTRVGMTTTTAQKKYGTASAAGGDSKFLQVSSSQLAMGTGNFTAEAWVRTWLGDPTIYGFAATGRMDGTDGFVLAFDQSWVGNNSGYDPVVIGSNTWATNTWHHAALTRSGNTIRFFRNGTLVGSNTTTRNLTGTIFRTCRYGDSESSVPGWIDEIRITKGVARYTAAFTPPTAAFPKG